MITPNDRRMFEFVVINNVNYVSSQFVDYFTIVKNGDTTKVIVKCPPQYKDRGGHDVEIVSIKEI